MDKPWIKAALIIAFVITLIFVYVSSYRALEDVPATPINVTAPAPPAFTKKPVLPDNPTPEQVTAYLASAKQAADIDSTGVQTYTSQVAAYKDEVTVQITAAKAKNTDRSARLDAYEKVVKDTLGTLILTPLLAALLIYSGIKVAGDVAASRALNTRTEIKAP